MKYYTKRMAKRRVYRKRGEPKEEKPRRKRIGSPQNKIKTTLYLDEDVKKVLDGIYLQLRQDGYYATFGTIVGSLVWTALKNLENREEIDLADKIDGNYEG